ncbi:MAG TPA: SelB C-terminal domain-containing protein [Nocardioides sp.]|uniref:SelB domain-containing protein n=1 Tax=Nocardioides sp. TaxID=35761 RepID=UPI002F3F9490
MHVVATAGHVDHGKSTLVSALTGQDPDRLDEEHRRGLSIELGYCWTDLDGIGDVAFVDVPGHERFLSTTLAGLGPVPVAMLVVAADDPWMPQAAEHLAALDAFGVRHGLVVVSRSDLADPAAALGKARAEVDRTSLAGCPAVVVSGRTGAGLEELRAELVGVLAGVTADPSSDVRLWADRVFRVAGAGTVVTGTLPAGTVRVGDELAFGEESVRVRGLESLGRPAEEVSGPARVALRLGGRAPSALGRGSALVTPGAYAEVTEVDVRLHGEGRVPETPLLHVGSTRVAVRARALGDRYARLRLGSPLPLRHGDRVALRDPGSRHLWGADVLDAAPPGLGRRGAARARAVELAGLRSDVAGELDRRGAVRRSLLRRLGVDADPVPPEAASVGDWLVSGQQLAVWRKALHSAVSGAPDGLSPEAAARAIGLPDRGLIPVLVAEPVSMRAGRLVVDQALPEPVRHALETLHSELRDDPFRAPDADRLVVLGLDRGTVGRLARDGHLLALGDGVVLLPGADDTAYDVLGALPQPFTTSQARQALGTSRRVVLPLLAHLDRAGRTVRLPDDTRRVLPRQTAAS